MTKIALAFATFLIFSGAAMAGVYKLDSKGKCHDEHGKFAKAEMCKTMAMGPVHTYKYDTKKKCRDEKGHFAEDKFCKV